MSRFIPTIVLLNLFSFYVMGQAGSISNMDQRIYKYSNIAPEAAALERFGEVPVSLHTGVPSISVPLYTMELPGFNVPIGLNYHAGGIKVDDVATNTGLGWVLDCGGAIHQQKNGMSDFHGINGWLSAVEKVINHPPAQDIFLASYHEFDPYFAYMIQAAYNTIDTQADLFSYSVPGESGKFYFDQSRKAYFLPKRGNKVTFSPQSLVNRWADSLILLDEKGNRFVFGALDESRTIKSGNPPPPVHHSLAWATAEPEPIDYNCTYYLSKIITRNNDTIRYTYEIGGGSFRNQNSMIRYSEAGGGTGAGGPVYCLLPTEVGQTESYTYTSGLRVKEIVSSRGHIIKFTYSTTNRKDLPGTNALTEVNIYHETNLLKKYTLSYDYFYSASPSSTNPDEFRLKLLSVQEQGKPATTFHYEETQPLPARLSYSQDHWGFYNGAFNTTLLPANAAKGFPIGANRSVDVSFAKRGSLREIRYPAGGKTVFEFDGNDGLYTGKKIVQTAVNRRVLSSPGDTSTTNFTLPGGFFQLRAKWAGPAVTGDELVRLTYLVDGSVINFSGSSTAEGSYLALAPGEYEMKVFENTTSGGNYYLRIEWLTEALGDTSFTHLIGGLRVRSIKSYTNINDAIPAFAKYYSYRNFDNPSASSGVSAGPPQYEYLTHLGTHYMNPGTCTSVFAQTAGSITPLGIYQNGPVVYNNVEERTDSLGTSGRSRYYFDNSNVGKFLQDYPFVPTISRSWRIGLQNAAIHSGAIVGGFQNAAIERNEFNIEERDYATDVLNMAVGIERIDVPEGAHGGDGWIKAYFVMKTYYFYSGQTLLKKEEKVRFPIGSTTDSIKTVKHYFYANPKHDKPTRIVEESSDRDILTKNIYPLDYDTAAITNNNAKGIALLARKNIYVEPIETYTQIKKDGSGDSLTTTGIIRHYKPSNTILDSVSVLNISQPLTAFSPSTIAAGGLSKDVNYKTEAAVLMYDDRNNILEQTFTGKQIVESFIWDYKKLYPIAKVDNAAYADIAYTSFEADGKGNWTFSGATASDNTSPTGSKCYAVQNGALSRTVSPDKTYLVSYWTKNGTPFTISGTQSGFPLTLRTFNGWTLYQHKVTGVPQIQISGTGFVDELRLHPADAQMVTSTYDPLVGVTNQSDASGHISYFVYDANKRLRLIKDADGRILKQFDYQYQAPSP